MATKTQITKATNKYNAARQNWVAVLTTHPINRQDYNDAERAAHAAMTDAQNKLAALYSK